MKTAVFYEHILEGAKQSGKSVAELMEKCASWNIRGIEIGDALLRENKEEIKELLEKNHMQVSCSNAFYDFGHNPDAAQGKKQIDLAEEFGVSKVLIIPGELSENEAAALNALSASKEQTDSYMSENASIQNMVQALKELVAYGKEKNILVTLEDFDGPVQPFARMYQLLWFMENVPGLKFTLDTGNFAYSDEDAVQAYEVLKDYIVHTHAKDGRRNYYRAPEEVYGLVEAEMLASPSFTELPLGTGNVDFAAYLKALDEIGYHGFLTVEREVGDTPEKDIQTAVEFLQKLIH